MISNLKFFEFSKYKYSEDHVGLNSFRLSGFVICEGMTLRSVGLRICFCVSAALSLIAGTAAAQGNLTARDLSGTWWIEHYDPQLRPERGDLPFTQDGKALYEKNIAGLKNGSLADRTVAHCLPEGLPRAMNSAYPLQIVQHKDLVTIIHEANRTFWFVNINGKHTPNDDIDPAFMGESIGYWEGDTLVIDSIGFKLNSFIDATGIPYSDQLHVVQRIRKLKQGKQLENVILIEDPVIFAKPWTVRRTYEWRPDVQIMEFVCGESHRYLPGDRSKAIRLNWTEK